MTKDENEVLEVIKGFFLLVGCHFLASLFIYGLSMAVLLIHPGNYTFLAVLIIGGIGFLFWQLIWVIPLVIWLQKRGKAGMMKGVIIGAVITALLNGSCFLMFV